MKRGRGGGKEGEGGRRERENRRGGYRRERENRRGGYRREREEEKTESGVEDRRKKNHGRNVMFLFCLRVFSPFFLSSVLVCVLLLCFVFVLPS